MNVDVPEVPKSSTTVEHESSERIAMVDEVLKLAGEYQRYHKWC